MRNQGYRPCKWCIGDIPHRLETMTFTGLDVQRAVQNYLCGALTPTPHLLDSQDGYQSAHLPLHMNSQTLSSENWAEELLADV